MPQINNSPDVNKVFTETVRLCQQYRHEFITPEHMLRVLLDQEQFAAALKDAMFDQRPLKKKLDDLLKEMERVPDDVKYAPTPSVQMDEVLETAYNQVRFSSAEVMDVPHLVQGILELEDSQACYLLKQMMPKLEDMTNQNSHLMLRVEDVKPVVEMA